MRRLLTRTIALALLAAACGGSGDDAGPSEVDVFPEGSFVIRASSDLAVGPERLLLAVSGPNNERLGGPDIAVTFELWSSAAPDRVQQVPATWTWAVPEVSGLYRADVSFDTAGIWNARVVPEGGIPLDIVPLEVKAVPLAPAVGTAAPPSATPTSSDVAALSEITTDREPEPAFYEISVADAVASGRPSVIVFATPLYCQTAICGPTLDDVKAVAPEYPNVNWVHVEIFTNLDDPPNREIVPAVREWQLPTEPWVFVVDAAGKIAARFEGVITAVELRSALDRLV